MKNTMWWRGGMVSSLDTFVYLMRSRAIRSKLNNHEVSPFQSPFYAINLSHQEANTDFLNKEE